jgi:predicted ester cyclase
VENQVTITANEHLVEGFINRVFNGHNAGATSDYFSSDVQWHGGTLGTIEGSDAMTSFYGELFAALPDLQVTTVGIAADGDTVWCRFVIEATNEGDVFGFPATGKQVRWDEIDAYRVADRKIPGLNPAVGISKPLMESCSSWRSVSHTPRSNFEAIRPQLANSEERSRTWALITSSPTTTY